MRLVQSSRRGLTLTHPLATARPPDAAAAASPTRGRDGCANCCHRCVLDWRMRTTAHAHAHAHALLCTCTQIHTPASYTHTLLQVRALDWTRRAKYRSVQAMAPLLPRGGLSLLRAWPGLLVEIFSSLRVPNYASYAKELLDELLASLAANLGGRAAGRPRRRRRGSARRTPPSWPRRPRRRPCSRRRTGTTCSRRASTRRRRRPRARTPRPA